MSFAAAPSRQRNWDARAAANFVCGGAGSGLIVFAVVAGESRAALALPLLAGLALIGTGLLCVWHELGRPSRALHVFFHPRTSWMTREAYIAALLFPCALAAAAGIAGFVWPTAALAFVFLYCQGRMLHAARGIPSWRHGLVPPLLVVTGLAEGAGLWLVAATWLRSGTQTLLSMCGVLVLLRILIWLAYRRAIATQAPRAHAALEATSRVLQLAGTLLPLAAIATIAVGLVSGMATFVVAAVAGLAAAASGAYMKFTLVTKAGFTQGAALARLPVRGVRRTAPILE
ncbi:MAG TPA: phenylacetyl-CoA:acceptor oxidoreductase [Casimicrobiaceae bacterium]|nr:phenylacetyl-CoA:acceptor oxidoreductase [Casimicrobiaceae bacterium]